MGTGRLCNLLFEVSTDDGMDNVFELTAGGLLQFARAEHAFGQPAANDAPRRIEYVRSELCANLFFDFFLVQCPVSGGVGVDHGGVERLRDPGRQGALAGTDSADQSNHRRPASAHDRRPATEAEPHPCATRTTESIR